MFYPLGVKLFKNSDVIPVRVNLNQGVYVYTDGLIEDFNEAGEMYGEQRLLGTIQSNFESENRVETIIDNAISFRGSVDQNDDILLLEIICDKSLIKKNEKQNISYNEIVPEDWHIRLELQFDIIRNINPVPVIIQSIADLQGLGNHREKIFLILTEMYSNALEHGVLNLESSIKEEENGFIKYYEMRRSRLNELTDGFISIDIEHYVEGPKGIVSITMENNGDGFDYKNVHSKLDEYNKISGRGIGLINILCRKFEFSDSGRKLNIEYEWEYTTDSNNKLD